MSESEQALEIRRLLKCQGKGINPFAVLNLDIGTCDVADVNRSFRRIALLLHPDKCKLPHTIEAFRISENAYKLLREENVLDHLKRAYERQKESIASSFPGPSVVSKAAAAATTPERPLFGRLSILATSGLSSDEQKSGEIQRLLQCKQTDYFVILDLDPAHCDVADVDKRYRRMAQALHPDKCQIPGVADAFRIFEKAHKELADGKKLVRYKMAFEQQLKRESALRSEMLQRASHIRPDQMQSVDGGRGLTQEQRMELRKKETLREQQMEAARLGDEAVRKRQKMEEKVNQERELAAELERQRKEWRELELF